MFVYIFDHQSHISLSIVAEPSIHTHTLSHWLVVGLNLFQRIGNILTITTTTITTLLQILTPLHQHQHWQLSFSPPRMHPSTLHGNLKSLVLVSTLIFLSFFHASFYPWSTFQIKRQLDCWFESGFTVSFASERAGGTASSGGISLGVSVFVVDGIWLDTGKVPLVPLVALSVVVVLVALVVADVVDEGAAGSFSALFSVSHQCQQIIPTPTGWKNIHILLWTCPHNHAASSVTYVLLVDKLDEHIHDQSVKNIPYKRTIISECSLCMVKSAAFFVGWLLWCSLWWLLLLWKAVRTLIAPRNIHASASLSQNCSKGSLQIWYCDRRH